MPGFDNTFLNNVTREKFLPGLRNTIYKKPVLFNLLNGNGRVQEMTGRGLIWDVVLTKHASVGLFGGYDTLASQPVNPVQQASLSPANYYATLAISGDEERQNSGNVEKLLDMLKTQTDNAYSTLRENIITDLYAANTSVGGRNTFVGLGAIIDNDNTYAGFNRSSTGFSDWQAQVDATAHTMANLKDSTHASYFPSILRTSWGNAAFDGQVDTIVTTNKLYNLYQDIFGFTALRGSSKMADLGMEGVMFQGNVNVTFDKYATANTVYGLNTSTFDFFFYPGANFDLMEGGWQKPVNQDAKVAHILVSGQLVCRVPRENFIQSSVGAS